MTLDDARPDDLPALCGLLALLFEQEADFAADPAKQAAGLSLLLGDPARGRVFVARDAAGAAVGMVSVQALVSTACGGEVLLLEDLVVRPELRRRGIGGALLERALAFARQGGFARVTLLTDRVNDGARRFYARRGFSASEMVPYRLLLT